VSKLCDRDSPYEGGNPRETPYSRRWGSVGGVKGEFFIFGGGGVVP